jgi:hypothetical protein
VHHRRGGVAEGARLLLDRSDDLGMTVPEVHGDEPASEVQVLLPVGVVEVRALRAHDDRCGEAALNDPRAEDVFRVFGLELGGRGGGGHVASILEDQWP